AFIGPFIAAFWCLPVCKRKSTTFASAGRSHRVNAPAFFGLGILSFAIGEAFWAYYELVLHRPTPFPSIADVFFIAAYPAMIFAVWLLPSGRLSPGYRARVLLDGAISTAALMTVSWYFLLGPIILNGSGSFAEKALGAIYPVADIAILCCL